MEFFHQPVLLNEVLELLLQMNDGIFVDGTLGGGGHSFAVADKLKFQNSKFKIIGIDQDLEAIFAAKKNLKKYADQIEFVHDNFSNLPAILKSKGVGKVNMILLDLGVSSFQFDDPRRGFSFQKEAPLDMRMNQSNKEAAIDIVNNYSEKDLADIFYEYGGERNSRRIAKNILEARKSKTIKTTTELTKIVEQSFPSNYQRKFKIHSATRVFQALRIETNNELNILEEFIPIAAKFLNSGGRLIIISFHSLEDRIVKQTFRYLANNNPDKFKILTKKPLTASSDEVAKNPRSRSAKMRILENI